MKQTGIGSNILDVFRWSIRIESALARLTLNLGHHHYGPNNDLLGIETNILGSLQ